MVSKYPLSPARYPWKVEHCSSAQLEEVLNSLAEHGFAVYQIFPSTLKGKPAFHVIGVHHSYSAKEVRRPRFVGEGL